MITLENQNAISERRKSILTHIFITNNTRQGAVEWLGPVSDEEYQNCHSAGNSHPA
jgi:hypothetical protein